MQTTPTLQFAPADIAWFAQMGHDRSPLHCDEAYAKRSPYGQPLVHGVLAALASIGTTGSASSMRTKRLVIEFPRPLFADTTYVVTEEREEHGRMTLRVTDGTLLVLRALLEREEGEPVELDAAGDFAPAAHAARPGDAALAAGTTWEIPFAMPARALDEIARRFGTRERGLDDLQVAVVAGASYVIGMHVPGERALFSRAQFTFFAPSGAVRLPLDFRCHARSFDARMNRLRLDVDVHAGAQPVAKLELTAFARVASRAPAPLPAPLRVSLDGENALVIGGARGLGAALAMALAARGARVVTTYLHAGREALALVDRADGLPGSITALKGDGRDLGWCRTMRDELRATGRSPRFLFCNAAPPLRSLWLDHAAQPRIVDYITQAVGLFTAPLTTFVADVANAAGTVVVSSSSVVAEPVAEWPHYVGAKAAVEGLTHAAAREHPSARFILVRPPSLATDFAPNLGAMASAMAPELVAHTVMGRLEEPRVGHGVELVDRFGNGA